MLGLTLEKLILRAEAHRPNASGGKGVPDAVLWTVSALNGQSSRALVPGHIRSGHGPEVIARAVRTWMAAVGATTATIEPGSPWRNGARESCPSRLRDDLLKGALFCRLCEAEVVIGSWRHHHATQRPHSSLGNMPPAPEGRPVTSPPQPHP